MQLPSRHNVLRPVAEGYEALLTYGTDLNENLYLQIFPTRDAQVLRDTAQQASVTPDIKQNPEDYRPGQGRIFSRSRFSGGDGLARAHRPNPPESDASRYWDGENIRITAPRPGQKEQVTLAREVGAVTGVTATGPLLRIADSPRVFWYNGQDVKRSDNIHAASPTVTSEDPEAGGTPSTVAGLAADGRTVYAALGAEGIHKRTWAGVWSHWSDLAATDIWVAKGRVIAAVDNVLYEAAAGADSVVLKTLEVEADWNDVIDAGHLILAAASDGRVYAFSQEAGSLILRGESGLRPGEEPMVLGYADQLVFVGIGDDTTAGGRIGRLYVGELAGTRLANMQLIREWGSETTSTNHAPQAMAATRDEMLVVNLDDDADLACWSWLLPTAAFYRRMYLDASNVPTGVVAIDDRVVVSRSGATLVRELATYADSGWIIFPWADFYSAADKSWVGLRIENKPFTQAGAALNLSFSTTFADIDNNASTTWTVAKVQGTDANTITATRSSYADEIPLEEITGRGLAMKVDFTASTDGTVAPVLYSVSSRMLEGVGEGGGGDVTFTIPVNVSDLQERPGKTPIYIRGRGKETYAALRAREGLPAELEMFRLGEKIRGQVNRVTMPQPFITPRGSSILISYITVQGAAISA